MLSVAHGTIGALIVTKIPNPYISIPLAIGSHFIADYTPHWDVGQGLTKKKKKKSHAFIQEILFDFPLSLILVYFLFQFRQPFSPLPWIGWFAGLLPDFLEFPTLFLNWHFFPFPQLARFHSSLHHSTHKKFIGLLPQIAVLFLVYLLR